MKNILIILILQFLVFNSKAQSNFALYCNTGIPVYTNFDNPPTHSAFGDFGFRYYFHKGLSISLEANSVFFKQSIDFTKANANYYTQTNGIGLVLMNETKISKRSFIGIGVGGSNGFFNGRVFAQNIPYYIQTTGGAPYPKITNVDFLTFKGQILFKHTVNKFFDTQVGLSYNMSQSYFLDMTSDIKNKQYDSYSILFVGCVFKFKESSNHVKGTGSSGGSSISRKIKCPSF
jgi:hypothetical protein